MSSLSKFTVVMVTGLCAGPIGCDDVAPAHHATPVDDEVTFRDVADNGIELNGRLLNGIRLNGIRLNGIRLNGIRLNGTELDGFSLTEGSRIAAVVGSEPQEGAQLVGVEYDMDYESSPGVYDQRKIKIAGVVQSSTDPDIYFNDVRYLNGETWDYLCRDGVGDPTEAIALNFVWDEDNGTRLEYADAFTWACRGAALAKAVEWGYAPWRDQGGTSLKAAHQAAVRMIRADYCGTGASHTVNGNPIDVSDKWGIQEPGTAWPVEAKWDEDGAVCLNTPCRAAWTREAVIAECEAAGKGTLPYCTGDDPGELGGMLMTQANAL